MNNVAAWIIPSIIILLFMSAFFSASETALLIINRIRLRHMISRKIRNSSLIHKLVLNLDGLVATILVGNNFVNVALSVLTTVLFVHYFGNTFFVALLVTIITAGMVLFFGEIIPKTFSLRAPDRVAIMVAPFVNIAVKILSPITKLFTTAAGLIMSLFGIKAKKHSPLITEEEVRLMIEAGKEEGLFGEQQRQMLHRIFEFGTTMVKDVMIPKDKMVSIDVDSTQDKLLNVMAEQGHSRIAVYKGAPDNVIGIICVRDVLYLLRDGELIKIPDLLSAPYCVPPEKRVNDLLRDFQRMKIQIAIVTNAAGRVQGLVTLEDLIEEIVGEI